MSAVHIQSLGVWRFFNKKVFFIFVLCILMGMSKLEYGGVEIPSSPVATINMITTNVSSMGANDMEIPALRQIIVDYLAGRCTSEDAVKNAFAIQDRKMADH